MRRYHNSVIEHECTAGILDIPREKCKNTCAAYLRYIKNFNLQDTRGGTQKWLWPLIEMVICSTIFTRWKSTSKPVRGPSPEADWQGCDEEGRWDADGNCAQAPGEKQLFPIRGRLAWDFGSKRRSLWHLHHGFGCRLLQGKPFSTKLFFKQSCGE